MKEQNMQQRINEYLQSGGLFNPELADHLQVRDLLVDCRNYIQFLEDKLGESALRESGEMVKIWQKIGEGRGAKR